ncbi:MAG: sn-glycerol-3-phosphate ABC transporter ATP-binding protein UgpC [Gammaproteobacteria bacterium]|jgi:multiple sugar transport system ATP-binding protein|nr:sn-glycerol-3-phosphate ABC transporter ATP-binding protein UgpC [Gammaproteobacteria bacterium]|tara:strand:- start:448 stop:1545 length:1098 start_codon:yes stop_codon:yes gene_type:complete
MATINIRSLYKQFDDTEAVSGIDLDISDGEFVVLVGPSGCGKTTTLRMIAGLEEVTGGTITVDGQTINDMAPKDRDVAMVFQNYALYPHMTVFENMAFGLRFRKIPGPQIKKRVAEVAGILGIEELLERRPKQLSGGQRQRVAMGRAIVRKPRVFLFDEPLSNLDAKLRAQMRTEIKRLHATVKSTVVYVTHDQVEAMTLADRIVVMNQGRIEQIGSPQELYENPKTHFVAGFIGSPSMNFIPCEVVLEQNILNIHIGGNLRLKVPKERCNRYKPFLGKKMLFGIRPEHLTDSRSTYGQDLFEFKETVLVVEPTGMDTMVLVDVNGIDVWARSNPSVAGHVGEEMSFSIDLKNMYLINPETNRVV